MPRQPARNKPDKSPSPKRPYRAVQLPRTPASFTYEEAVAAIREVKQRRTSAKPA